MNKGGGNKGSWSKGGGKGFQGKGGKGAYGLSEWAPDDSWYWEPTSFAGCIEEVCNCHEEVLPDEDEPIFCGMCEDMPEQDDFEFSSAADASEDDDESIDENVHGESTSTTSTSSTHPTPVSNEPLPEVTVLSQPSSSTSPVTLSMKEWPTLPVTPESIRNTMKR